MRRLHRADRRRAAPVVPDAARGVDGAEVSTVEGLGDPDDLSTVQAAFNEHYAAQCGFCTSGFLMASHALDQSGGGTSRDGDRRRPAGHVCRCTGYVKIIDAVTAAARGDDSRRSPRPTRGRRVKRTSA